MAFAMRINFVDVICDDRLVSLKAGEDKVGYAFDIRLSYYRGAYLSCVDEFELKIDGEVVDPRWITFGINGKSIPVGQLSQCVSEFWRLIDPARIEVLKEGGLTPGEHDIDLKLMLRVPYLPIPTGDGHMYMPLDSSGRKSLILTERVMV